MSFDDFIKGAFVLGKAIYDESQVKSARDSEAYQEELNDFIEEIEWKDDIELLMNFHEEYADDHGRGLFQMDAANRSNPMFMAYMELFNRRKIVMLELCCEECERRLGYRMAPKSFDIIDDVYELKHGRCSCYCGETKCWEIEKNFDGESSIRGSNREW